MALASIMVHHSQLFDKLKLLRSSISGAESSFDACSLQRADAEVANENLREELAAEQQGLGPLEDAVEEARAAAEAARAQVEQERELIGAADRQLAQIERERESESLHFADQCGTFRTGLKRRIDKDTEDAPKIRVYIKQKEADLANAHGTAAGLADTLAAVCAEQERIGVELDEIIEDKEANEKEKGRRQVRAPRASRLCDEEGFDDDI
jgi:chromosome segregation ATPase